MNSLLRGFDVFDAAEEPARLETGFDQRSGLEILGALPDQTGRGVAGDAVPARQNLERREGIERCSQSSQGGVASQKAGRPRAGQTLRLILDS